MYRTVFNGKLVNRTTLSRVKRYASIRLQSSAQNAVRSLESGHQIHGYTVRKVVEVPEFSMTMVVLDHDKTGAEHLHLARGDSDNAFGVSFRTTPMDSTGVPHILEHTVLCGSKKYPVRDPFFKMLNRSLSTFMNAMTSSDWTIYPFSSQNEQDYENLMSIYLDAVFYPQLRELDFSQEGWRLELENPQDKTSSMIFKGVVFNEMKGVFSNSQRIFSESIRNFLCPSHTYGVVYGGDPNYIPDLTWKQLKDFHATHYHPSNARFFTYGDFPMEKQLQRIDEDYLRRFSKISPDTSVPKEPRWTERREARIACAPDPMAPDPLKQTTVAVSFLLADINDAFETFTMSLIGALLVEGETSPFYRSLVESKLGSDYSPDTGCQAQTLESSFSVGLQNVSAADVNTVKGIIDETLDKVIEEGFEEERIEAWLHQIELSMKHQTRNFGITLGVSITPARNHDSDPTEHLQINKFISKFRKQIKEDPKFLQKKVKQYFKDSHHRLTLIMSPDEKFLEKKQEEEKAKLTALTSRLDERDREIIHQRGLDLLEKQMQTEDLSCLPTINLKDIGLMIKPQTQELLTCGSVPLQVSLQPTNEVAYLRIISNLSDVPDNLLPYVPLFSMALTKMSTLSHDYKQLTQMSELWTGGLSSETHLSTNPSNRLSFEQGVRFSSYCLEKNLDNMLNLWSEIINEIQFIDQTRLKTLIMMAASSLSAGISDMGHHYAMVQSASSLSPTARLLETFSGMTQVNKMKELAMTENLDATIEALKTIGKAVLNKHNLRVAVNCGQTAKDTTVNKVENFLRNIPGNPISNNVLTKQPGFIASSNKTMFELPFSVNYVGKGFPSVPFSHPDFARLTVLAKIMTAKFLHREIREKGGAYGSGAVCGQGVFNMFSYRDPNCTQTLDVFDAAVKWAIDGKFEAIDVDEAKLTAFKQSDMPVTPGDMGMTNFLQGIDDVMRQTFRDQLFAVSRDDIIGAASRYLHPCHDVTGISCFGPENPVISQDQAWKVHKA